jgi:hypothetical protein
MRVLPCYGREGEWVRLIKSHKKTTTWRLWKAATIQAWADHVKVGGEAWLGRLMSTERYGRIRVTGVDFPRSLRSMTDAEARADGASAGESAMEWQTRQSKYFGDKSAFYCKVTFEYLD